MGLKDWAEAVSWLSPVGAAVSIASGDQPEDMLAMNRYMGETAARTTDARRLKTDWSAWYHDLSWYEMNIDQNTWMQARNKIAEFNLANAQSSKERDQVEEIQRRAGELELERLASQGKSLPIDQDTGKLIVPSDPSLAGVKLKWVWLGGTFTTISALAAYLAPFKYKPPAVFATMAGILGTGTYVAFKID